MSLCSQRRPSRTPQSGSPDKDGAEYRNNRCRGLRSVPVELGTIPEENGGVSRDSAGVE